MKGDLDSTAADLAKEKDRRHRAEDARNAKKLAREKAEKELEDRRRNFDSMYKASGELVESLRKKVAEQASTLAKGRTELGEAKKAAAFYERKLRDLEGKRQDSTEVSSHAVEEFKGSEDGKNWVTLIIGSKLVDQARDIMNFVNYHRDDIPWDQHHLCSLLLLGEDDEEGGDNEEGQAELDWAVGAFQRSPLVRSLFALMFR